jgi:hypothetical protein
LDDRINRDDRVNQDDQRPYPADKARGGEVILRRGWERAVFIAGLVGAIVLVLVITWFR